MRLVASALWRRLDIPAFDLCRSWTSDVAIALDGHVLTVVDGEPTEIAYEVVCDDGWVTQSARVEIRRRGSTTRVEVSRDERGHWSRDGTPLPVLAGIDDVDLEFTPATNTLPIRRLSLAVGESASVNAAWIRFPSLELNVLPQRYTRTGENQYRYESAGGAFTATLEVDWFGLVARYADIWECVTHP